MSSYDVWFSVVEWPDGSADTEVSHFSSKELCEASLKEYLEDIFETSFGDLAAALEEAAEYEIKVWYTKAKVREEKK